MGKGKTLLCLLALLLLCMGGYALLSRPAGDAPAAQSPDETVDTLGISRDTVTALAWESAARELVFSRDTGLWHCTSEKHFPTDTDSPRFTAMLSALEDTAVLRYLDSPGDPADYGLDAPANTIRVTLADGTEHRFVIGDWNDLAGGYYVCRDDDPGVWVLGPALAEAFSCGLFELVDMDEIPDLTAATACQIGKTRLIRQEDAWCRSNGTPLAEDTARQLSNALTAFTWAQCIDFYADSDEVKNYEYNLEHGKTVTVTLPDGEYAFVIGNRYDKEHTIVSPVDSDLVYTVRTSTIDGFLLG